MTYEITDASADDLDSMLALFPRLANFDIPERRQPEELWQGDAELLEGWGRGELPDAIVKVARESDRILGVGFARLRKEALSLKPGAHLEVLAVAQEAEGRGIGTSLLSAVEKSARDLGALTLSLNVFGRNEKARGLYRKAGFDEELIRCIKDLV